MVTGVIFHTLRLFGQSSKKSKKSGAKGSVALLQETIQLGCVSQDSPQRESFQREKLRSNHTVKLPKATMRRETIPEKKGPSQGTIQKCQPQERISWAFKFEERTQDETQKQGRCTSGDAWDLAERDIS